MAWLLVGGFYLLQIIGVIVVILLGYFIYDKRYKKNHGAVPPGFVATSEVNIDPVSGEKTRVYYNPDTGERFYRKER